MRRSSHPIFWLLAVAILARGMLPWVHGNTVAHNSGNSILLVFCGASSPALIAKAQSLAPWATEDPQPAPSQSPLNDCPLCLVGAFALALLATAILQLLQRQRSNDFRAFGNPRWHAPPPSPYDPRGPPAMASLPI